MLAGPTMDTPELDGPTIVMVLLVGPTFVVTLLTGYFNNPVLDELDNDDSEDVLILLDELDDALDDEPPD